MGMELRTAPGEFIIGDYVGAMHPDLAIKQGPVYGRVTKIAYDGYMVTTVTGEETGPWNFEHVFHDVTAHVDYPHHPGTLYDCPGCEAIMEKDDNGDYVDPEGPGQHE